MVHNASAYDNHLILRGIPKKIDIEKNYEKK